MLTTTGLRVAIFRHRATFRRRWGGGYLSLVLLVGVVGGLALGSLAAARRTQSSFAAYLASTNPSDLGISVFGGIGNGGGSAPDYSDAFVDAVGRLPGVRHVEAAVPIIAAPLAADGAPRLGGINDVEPVASVNGLYFDQDRLAVVSGRMAHPQRANEVVMTALAARLLGVHIGEIIPYGIYSTDQQNESGFGTAKVPPERRVDARLVGLVQVNNALVEDDIDRYPTFEFFTPALGRSVVNGPGAQDAIVYGLRLDRGAAGVAAVEREFTTVSPPGNTYGFHSTQAVVLKVDRTIKPLVIALGVFGGVALLAALLIAVQVISRQLANAAGDLAVLRAFGADRVAMLADSLLGTVLAVMVGSLLAAVVAVALSPLAPLGPVRPVYPGRGFSADWTVLGIGVLVLILALSVSAFVLAYRGLLHRTALRAMHTAPAASRAVQVVATTGLPLPSLIGVRFALERGQGRTAVPVRSTILGAGLAVTLVVTTLTFGSGLQSLVSRPALYGWNFTYLLNASNTVPPSAVELLNRDPQVTAWDGYDYNVAELDGQAVPFLFEAGHSAAKQPLSPPILSGHPVDGSGQIVLGAATMTQLHKQLGDTVSVSYGSPQEGATYVPPRSYVVVGSATLPAVGFSSVVDDHTSMGTGAVISLGGLPKSFREASQSSQPVLDGPNLVFVRMAGDVSQATGRANLQRVADTANRTLAHASDGSGDYVDVLGVQRPAEIVDYGTIGVAPALLATALAASAVVALGLTLIASVRRRRRDLALLKSLGFTHGQLAGTVAWQATTSAALGIIIGVPLGIAAGRALWTLFAHQIQAVPEPTVPALSVALVALGTLVLANLVATLPGRMAARTPTARLLWAE